MQLNFISNENLKKHIAETIQQYGERLQAYDIKKFNSNIVDPIKLLFDKNVYGSSWDVIFKKSSGIEIEDCGVVSTVYVEMKNKHNTMNSAASAKTYMKMQGQLLRDDDCACMLVEVIAQKSQNVPWTVSLDGQRQKHRRIRRVSIDEFYKLVTGEDTAFYQLCMILPKMIDEVISDFENLTVPKDTVFEELSRQASVNSFELALYMLGFKTYLGFNQEN